MIQYKVQPTPVQSVLLTPCDTRKAEFLTPSAFTALQKLLPTCFYRSLKLSAPTDTSRDHRRGLSCSQWIMRCGVRQEGRERRKALKFLMRSLVFSLLNLYTSCLRAGWSYQHTTLHKQTSCHPWHRHTTWCAITAGMFPELVFHICVATWREFCMVSFHVFIFDFIFSIVLSA